jgi:hypothetical protein
MNEAEMKGLMLIFRPHNRRPTVKLLTKAPTARELQQIVGGWLEQIPGWTSLPCTFDDVTKQPKAWHPCIAVCNEEGKLHGQEVNTWATLVWDQVLRHQGHPGLVDFRTGYCLDALVGTVVVLTGDREFRRSLMTSYDEGDEEETRH